MYNRQMSMPLTEPGSERTQSGRQRSALSNVSTYKVAVYNTLREEIKTLELRPGERLVEEILSARFAISKTPIREALLMLQSDNLVELIPHVGGAVSWMSLMEYEQEIFLLDALELPAMELVAKRATAEDVDRWEAEVAEILRVYRAGDTISYRLLAGQLHGDIFRVSGYPRLVGLIGLIQQILFRYSVLFIDRDPSEKPRERELEIITMRVEYLRARDPSAAAKLVRVRHAEQLRRARERVEAGDPFVLNCLREGQ
jgi:DNA-binding GntR family transcriptional regulator